LLDALILTLGYAAAVCVGLVFVMAGVSKLRHRRLLSGVIANYRLLPEGLVSPVSAVLPITELVIGIALIGGERILAPLLAMMLLLVFAAAMGINLARGRRKIDCGCGQSHLRQTLNWGLVVRNVLLAGLLPLRLAAQNTPTLPQIGIALAGGLSIFLIYLLFNALLALSSLGSSHAHR
jgi:hypothetical protein